MNKKDLKKYLKSTFKNHTPNISTNIIKACQNEVQLDNKDDNNKVKLFSLKKLITVVSFVIILSLFIILNITSYDEKKSSTYYSIYLDVNPSIEIRVDDNYYVYECIPINDDALVVLENLQLTNILAQDAINKIISSMYIKGYLTSSSNSILISVEEGQTINLDELVNGVNNIFNHNNQMECSIIAQRFSKEASLKEKADKHHISSGKMHLIEKIIEGGKMYLHIDEDELSKMSIAELNLIYSSMKNKDNQDKDLIFGKPIGFLEHEKALIIVLDYLQLTKEDIIWHDTIALFHHQMEERKMIYLVTILKNGDDERYRYVVDCITGEILPQELIDEWENRDHFKPSPPPKK